MSVLTLVGAFLTLWAGTALVLSCSRGFSPGRRWWNGLLLTLHERSPDGSTTLSLLD